MPNPYSEEEEDEVANVATIASNCQGPEQWRKNLKNVLFLQL
jgi:hypothetical protein